MSVRTEIRIGSDDVGGVETATETYFKDGNDLPGSSPPRFRGPSLRSKAKPTAVRTLKEAGRVGQVAGLRRDAAPQPHPPMCRLLQTLHRQWVRAKAGRHFHVSKERRIRLNLLAVEIWIRSFTRTR